MRRAAALDAWLLAVPAPAKWLVLAATIVMMVAVSLPNVPRPYADLSRLPLLGNLTQQDDWGTDTIGDRYTARVVVHDVADMYTKTRTDQTPLEAATWSREASAPYPPAALLVEAAFFWLGERTGVGFYGFVLLTAVLFLASSLAYCLRTRWYLFPLLYLNFGYFSERFVHVQDNTYLIMLGAIMAALWLARGGHAAAAHLLTAAAITVKLSGLYYLKNLPSMSRPVAAAFIAILAAGLVAPYFIWDNYLYIYRYGSELKGHWYDLAAALVLVVPFGIVLWYVDAKVGFDLEDRIGWGLVPFAMLLAFKMNVPRHLLVVLLVPDKRVVRNLAAAVALLVPAAFPGAVRFGAATPLAAVTLIGGLGYHLSTIGWATVRDDLRRPARTLGVLLAGRTP